MEFIFELMWRTGDPLRLSPQKPFDPFFRLRVRAQDTAQRMAQRRGNQPGQRPPFRRFDAGQSRCETLGVAGQLNRFFIGGELALPGQRPLQEQDGHWRA